MGADRFIHKRAGAGDRTNQLSHLEWRVWTVYQLAADDFGVMRFDVGSLIEAHPCLGREKSPILKAALERMATVMRLPRFTSHGLDYIFQTDWQDFQKADWAQMTTRPKPPDELIATCSPWTQLLFSVWPGQKRIPPKPDATKKRRNRDGVATESGFGSDNLGRESRDRADGYGYGYSSEDPEGGVGETAAADRLWAAWRQAMGPRMVLPLQPKHLEVVKLVEACTLVPEEPRRLEALQRFFALSDVERKARGIKALTVGYFVMALPDLVNAPPPAPTSCRHRHVPACASDAACTRRYQQDLEARARADA